MEINLAPENEFLTPDEVARLLRKPSRKVLAVDRCLGRDHPPYIKIGRKILYKRADVLRWLDGHVINPPARGEQRTVTAKRAGFERIPKPARLLAAGDAPDKPQPEKLE
jgi:hypothetical protein